MRHTPWLSRAARIARRKKAARRAKAEARPIGPHCFLRQGRHPKPFNKTTRGADRRAARKLKSQVRAEFFSAHFSAEQEMMP